MSDGRKTMMDKEELNLLISIIERTKDISDKISKIVKEAEEAADNAYKSLSKILDETEQVGQQCQGILDDTKLYFERNK